MGDVDHVGDDAATEARVNRGPIPEDHTLVGQQGAALDSRWRNATGGTATHTVDQGTARAGARIKFGSIAIGGVGLGADVGGEAIVLDDLDAAGNVDQANRNRVVRHYANGAIATLVVEADGVFDGVARMQVRPGRSADLGRCLEQGRDDVRPEQVGDEHQRMREIDVLRGGEAQRCIDADRGVGAVAQMRQSGVGRCVGDVDQLQVNGEIVQVCRIARSVHHAEIGDAAVPEVGESALHIGEGTGVDDIPTGQLELVAGESGITFPNQRAHVGREITTDGGGNAVDRDGLVVAGADRNVAGVVDLDAPIGLGRVAVGNDQCPATVVAEIAIGPDRRGEATT